MVQTAGYETCSSCICFLLPGLAGCARSHPQKTQRAGKRAAHGQNRRARAETELYILENKGGVLYGKQAIYLG